MIGVWGANKVAAQRARDFARMHDFVVLEDFGGLDEELFLIVYDVQLGDSQVKEESILKKFNQFQIMKVLIVGDNDHEPYSEGGVEFARVRFDNDGRLKEYLSKLRESNEGVGAELKD